MDLIINEIHHGWYRIERKEHDGRSWYEPTDHGRQLFLSSRLVQDACVEGILQEMSEVAIAIKNRTRYRAKRCAVDATKEPVLLWSPKNSTVPAEVSAKEADELADLIMDLENNNG